MLNQRPCFRFEVDNFSEKEATIASHTFVSGGCEWYLYVNPKGHSLCDDQLPLFLGVSNPKSLGRGWERRADYYFVLLNQSDKELYKTPIAQRVGFWAKTSSRVFRRTLPLSKFQEKGFLENDKLIIEVYIKVIEAFDGEGGEVAPTVNSVRNILAEHPEIAEDFKPKNQVVKKDCMNISRNACSKLSELAEVGFKLDWLKSKLSGEVSSEGKKVGDSDESRVQELEERIKNLEEVSLEKKKPDDTEGSPVQQLEERVKNLEQLELGFKLDCFKSKLEEVSLERKTSTDTDGSRVQQLEERLNNLEKMAVGFKLDFMSNFERVSLKRKTSSDAVGSRVQQSDERLKNLELMESSFKLDCINSKLEEVSLERKTSDEAAGSWVQQLEERLKNLELMDLGFNLSCIKSKLEEVSPERKTSDEAVGSMAQKLEEHPKNLKLMELGSNLSYVTSKLEEVSLERKKSDDANGSLAKQFHERLENLELFGVVEKFELDKEKDKSCDDDFLLVDEAA
ncbi:MATH domain and coiled-coil domain-containing protein [Cardamine amara subsp. amara]|uniref:MATH domain and coiled-coil domain-containing protein n=1 Tax=Cardamine amara subsp. amara TaxID=228776 RepID=A0ABD0ZKV9_CARAN